MDVANERETSPADVPTLPGGSRAAADDDGFAERRRARARSRVARPTGYGALVPPLLPSMTPGGAPRLAPIGPTAPSRSVPSRTEVERKVAESAVEPAAAVAAVAVATIDEVVPDDLDDRNTAGDTIDPPSSDEGDTDLEMPADPFVNDRDGAVPINPLTGLPMGPSGPVTPTPQWRKRKKSGARKVLNALMGLAVFALTVAIVWAALNTYLPSDSEPDSEPEPVAEPVAQDDDAVVLEDTSQRPEVDQLLDELAIDASGQPLTPVDAARYSYKWIDQFRFTFQVTVDSGTSNFIADTDKGTQVVHAGDQYFGKSPDNQWIELSPTAGAAIPVISADGPPVLEEVLPPAIQPYVLAEKVLPEGWTFHLIDDARLAVEDPAARQAWLEPWGALEDIELPAPSDDHNIGELPRDPVLGEITFSVNTQRNGVVGRATMVSPSIGGVAAYRLLDWSEEPLTVVPPGFVGGS